MISGPRLDALAAKVAAGTALSSVEAFVLINSLRQLLHERTQWPRRPVTSRLRRSARAAGGASPARWHQARAQ